MKKTNRLNRRDFLEVAGCAIVLSPLASRGAVMPVDPGSVYKNNSLLGKGSEVTITPREGWRDKVGDYAITVKLGKEGMPAGDSLGIVNGSLMDRWQFTFPSHFWYRRQPWQSTDKTEPNHVTATCSRAGVTLNVTAGQPLPKGHDNRPSHFVKALRNRKRGVLEISAGEALREGDVIEIRWQTVKAPSYAMRYLFMPFLILETAGAGPRPPHQTGRVRRATAHQDQGTHRRVSACHLPASTGREGGVLP